MILYTLRDWNELTQRMLYSTTTVTYWAINMGEPSSMNPVYLNKWTLPLIHLMLFIQTVLLWYVLDKSSWFLSTTLMEENVFLPMWSDTITQWMANQLGLVYMDLNSFSSSNPVVLLKDLGRPLIHAVDDTVPHKLWILNYRHWLLSFVQHVFTNNIFCYCDVL